MALRLLVSCIQDWVSTSPWIKIEKSHVRVESNCLVAISSMDEPECGQREGCLTYNDDPQSFAMCAQNLANQNVANCFEGCIICNG